MENTEIEVLDKAGAELLLNQTKTYVQSKIENVIKNETIPQIIKNKLFFSLSNHDGINTNNYGKNFHYNAYDNLITDDIKDLGVAFKLTRNDKFQIVNESYKNIRNSIYNVTAAVQFDRQLKLFTIKNINKITFHSENIGFNSKLSYSKIRISDDKIQIKANNYISIKNNEKIKIETDDHTIGLTPLYSYFYIKGNILAGYQPVGLKLETASRRVNLFGYDTLKLYLKEPHEGATSCPFFVLNSNRVHLDSYMGTAMLDNYPIIKEISYGNEGDSEFFEIENTVLNYQETFYLPTLHNTVNCGTENAIKLEKVPYYGKNLDVQYYDSTLTLNGNNVYLDGFKTDATLTSIISSKFGLCFEATNDGYKCNLQKLIKEILVSLISN